MTEMFKVTVDEPKKSFIMMYEMEPGQIGIIEDETHNRNGSYVMRTLNTATLEFMNLSYPKENNFWVGKPEIKVRLLPSYSEVIIKIL